MVQCIKAKNLVSLPNKEVYRLQHSKAELCQLYRKSKKAVCYTVVWRYCKSSWAGYRNRKIYYQDMRNIKLLSGYVSSNEIDQLIGNITMKLEGIND